MGQNARDKNLNCQGINLLSRVNPGIFVESHSSQLGRKIIHT